jgi:predicted nucleic-acid-binding Zn-ribbon protein
MPKRDEHKHECPKCHSKDIEAKSCLMAGGMDDNLYQDYECLDCGHGFQMAFTVQEASYA